MISLGKNLTHSDDELSRIDMDELYQLIREPSEVFAEQVRRLRLIRNLDQKQYTLLKRQLPYIVCAAFSPAYRRLTHFGYTEYFVIDIDHLSEKDLLLEEKKAQLIADPRVVMCFTSPSEDGLKLLYRLSEKCYDAKQYSVFNKCFIKELSQKYALNQVVDERTSDVTRACFLSVDPQVYYNPTAETVDITQYIGIDNPYLFQELFQSQRLEAKEKPIETVSVPTKPSPEIYDQIKARLNPNGVKRMQNKKTYHVPKILDEIESQLKAYIQSVDLVIEEIRDISYGKKIRCCSGVLRAEVNVFYGKRGFNPVASPRSGTDEQLNELLVEYIQNFLYEYAQKEESSADFCGEDAEVIIGRDPIGESNRTERDRERLSEFGIAHSELTEPEF